jgi:hypothetical protein
MIRHAHRFTAGIVALTAFLMISMPAQSAMLDINLTRSGAPTETGFDAWETGDRSTPSQLVVDGVTLSMVESRNDNGTPNNKVRSLERSDTYNGALDNLTQTWWGARGGPSQPGGFITFDIAGLAAGDYLFTSWHHDHGNQTGEMDIEVSTDGGSTFDVVGDDFGIVDSVVDGNVGAPNPFTFGFTAGGDSVQIRYTNVSGSESTNDFVIINGFSVEVIPEPASLALLGLLAVSLSNRGGLLIAKRRKA